MNATPVWSSLRSATTLTAAALLVALAGCTIERQSAAPTVVSTTERSATAAPASASYAVINGEQVPVPEIALGDPAVIARIIEEGTKRNRVMEHLTYLCTEIGPRLTGSSAAEAANKWARDKFEAWGLVNAHLDEWGTVSMRFDRGPSTGAAYMRRERRTTNDAGESEVVVEHDKLRDLQFTTLAWTRGTNGPARGPAIRMPSTLEELEAVQDKLAGAWIVIPTDYSGRRGIRGVGGQMSARHGYWDDLRKQDGEAEGEAAAPAASGDTLDGTWTGMLKGGQLPGEGIPVTLRLTRDGGRAVSGTFTVMGSDASIENGRFNRDDGALTFTRRSDYGTFEYRLSLQDGKLVGEASTEETTLNVELARAAEQPAAPSTQDEITRRVLAAGINGFVVSSLDERVWTTSARGWREMTPETIPTDVQVCVRESDYDAINSRIADGAPIELEFDLPHTFTPGPIPVYNTVAEIPGTEFPDEVVIVSAHLDSWNGPGSMGTTDNGTGSSVTLEAARILMASGAKPKRTIRFVLWTGEEQGLLGSRSYVERLGDDLDKISAVFVDDGGTNYQGGLHVIEPMAELLAAATAPVNGLFTDSADGKPLNVNIRIEERMPRGGGSDHASFNAKGIPGFFWDEVGRADYGYGWHTQHDRLDLAIPEYLQQSATCTAITAYNLACAPTMLPRQQEEPAAGGDERARRGRRPAEAPASN